MSSALGNTSDAASAPIGLAVVGLDDRLLDKPFTPTALLARVREVLDRA